MWRSHWWSIARMHVDLYLFASVLAGANHCICLPQFLRVQLIVFVCLIYCGRNSLTHASSQIIRSLMSVEIDRVAFTLVAHIARMHVELYLFVSVLAGATHCTVCLLPCGCNSFIRCSSLVVLLCAMLQGGSFSDQSPGLHSDVTSLLRWRLPIRDAAMAP